MELFGLTRHWFGEIQDGIPRKKSKIREDFWRSSVGEETMCGMTCGMADSSAKRSAAGGGATRIGRLGEFNTESIN